MDDLPGHFKVICKQIKQDKQEILNTRKRQVLKEIKNLREIIIAQKQFTDRRTENYTNLQFIFDIEVLRQINI